MREAFPRLALLGAPFCGGSDAWAQDTPDSTVTAPESGPARAVTSGSGASSSMFSNLANPAIGMNALITGQAAPGLRTGRSLCPDLNQEVPFS